MKKRLFTMALFASIALATSLGYCGEGQHSLVGAWQADVQPDKEKIERVLKESGMIKPLRLLVAPKFSKKLRATMVNLEFRSDGTCHLNDLSLSEGDNAPPAAAPKSRTWQIVGQEGNHIKVQVSTLEAKEKWSKKIYSFTFDEKGGLQGTEADWQEAPFATPRFVRVATATRPAATRR